MDIPNDYLEKIIEKSQRCQRNWDLSRSIPAEDIETMKVAVTDCASKQNRVFYKCKFITNRDIIEQIYDCTEGAGYTSRNRNEWHTLEELGFKNTQEAISNGYYKWTLRGIDIFSKRLMDKNPQVLANLLVAFIRDRDPSEGARTNEEYMQGRHIGGSEHILTQRDESVALGVGSGYLTLVANMLGYSTGFCQCFDPSAVNVNPNVSNILGETEDTLLLVGIGYPDPNLPRRIHHITGRQFPTYDKDIIVDDVL
jgi:nitroreductase